MFVLITLLIIFSNLNSTEFLAGLGNIENLTLLNSLFGKIDVNSVSKVFVITAYL